MSDPKRNISDKILDHLRAQEGKQFTPEELAATLGISSSRTVATSLANCMRRSSGDWKKVNRVGHGIYVFDSGLTRSSPSPWIQVGVENGLFILRDPEGNLYGARPLKEFLNA